MSEDIAEKIKKKIKSLSKRELYMYGGIAVCLAVLLIVSTAVSLKKPQSSPMEDNMAVEEVQQMPEEDSMETVTVDVDGVDPEMEKMVSLSIPESGRANPFLPPSDRGAYGNFDIITPPNSVGAEDSEAVKIVETKVSGIMYDNYSPSAILNIEGSDYLVRSGDVINNYKVLAISPTLVTVQLGSNVYKAGVGQMLTNGDVNYNDVPNLNNRFGGNKSSKTF